MSNESECLYRCSGVGTGALATTGFFPRGMPAPFHTTGRDGFVEISMHSSTESSRLLSTTGTDVLSLKLIHYKTKVLSIVLVPSIHQ